MTFLDDVLKKIEEFEILVAKGTQSPTRVTDFLILRDRLIAEQQTQDITLIPDIQESEIILPSELIQSQNNNLRNALIIGGVLLLL